MEDSLTLSKSEVIENGVVESDPREDTDADEKYYLSLPHHTLQSQCLLFYKKVCCSIFFFADLETSKLTSLFFFSTPFFLLFL